MDAIHSYTPYTPPPGTQQTVHATVPYNYQGASVADNLLDGPYTKALWPHKFDKDPVNWYKRLGRIWHTYFISSPSQLIEEFKNPTKLLTLCILAAGKPKEEDYFARYCGLQGGSNDTDWRMNIKRIIIRGLGPNRYPQALWDPRFDGQVGFGMVPSVYDGMFEQKLSSEYQKFVPRYERSMLEIA